MRNIDKDEYDWIRYAFMDAVGQIGGNRYENGWTGYTGRGECEQIRYTGVDEHE